LDGRVLQGTIEKLADFRGSSKKLTTWLEAAWVTQDGFFKSNEFFHEAAIGYLVRKYLSDVPMFSRALIQDAFYDKRKERAFLLFDKCAGEPLENIVNDLSVQELRSIILQVFAAICLGQQRLQLKHHDLHLLNILVSEIEADAERIWCVKLPFGTVEIPIVGFDVTIIDYGLSSANNPETGKRHVRLDEELIVDTTDHDATVVQDELENTYTLPY
jgi:serine/threonine protein kinase